VTSAAEIAGPVRFEHREGGLGIGTGTPRLSWQVTSDDPSWSATAYELELTTAAATTSVRVESSDQVLVPWPFEPLPARARATVRVRVASGPDWTAWSEPASVEVGLLASEDWAARFISPRILGGFDSAAPILARTFALRPGITSARLYATAHGVYVATLNGTRVGDEELAPGWTSYHHRLRYQTHDVASLLTDGDNTLEVVLGNGWYRGRLGWDGRRGLYGDRLALLAQLEVTYADGSVEHIATDEQWSARESEIVADDLYDGQRTDLRGPERAGSDAVEVLDEDLDRLVAADGPPVRVTQVVPAVSVHRSPSGRTIVDFGQNVVGWVRLRVRDATGGNEVTIRHAEVLEDGELAVRPLRTAKAIDAYVLADAAEVVLEPSLTFHGFRYAEVNGVTDLRVDDVEAAVVGSDLRRTGWFACSDPDLEQLHDNVVWGMRGNFLDVPTDCPQRDERLGWTGDIQIFSPTASFLFDTAGFLTSWLADLAADQYPDGSVPFVIPDVLGTEVPAGAAWGDAATVVPWVLYQRFGDRGILARQFESMRGWVDKAASLAGEDHLWSGGFQFGDWLDPAAPPDAPAAAKADPDVVATAHLARSAEIVGEAARILGHTAEAAHYAALSAATREAFAREYVTASGRVLSDAQTVYALALEWALLPDAAAREHAGRRLADLVRTSGFRIGTGFVGTPLMTDALSSAGEHDLAYRLLLEKGCPSWLYPVTMGATTVWERWDSMLPDGSVNPGQMTSFNHYALGAVADWMHRTVAGLVPSAPGYREITVRPVPGGGLTFASARHLTPYGEAAVAWRRNNDRFHLEVTVPVGASAVVHVPERDPVVVGHGKHTWTTADPVMARPAPSLHAESTVRQLIDSPQAWADTVAVLVEQGIGRDGADIARKLARYLDKPAVDGLRAIAPSHETVRKRIERSLTCA
jgi:alpha-L-rhamnosidase